MKDFLITAVDHGDIDLLVYHLSDNPKIHSLDCALQLASELGNREMVNVLLEYGANVHAKNNYALRIAFLNHNTEIIKLLITHGSLFSVAISGWCKILNECSVV